MSFDVSFFHCSLSVSLVILLAVVFNGDLFVQNINVSELFLSFSVFMFVYLFFLCFCFILFLHILYFILIRNRYYDCNSRPSCELHQLPLQDQYQPTIWPVCTTSECWHTRCWHFCSCSSYKTIPSLWEFLITSMFVVFVTTLSRGITEVFVVITRIGYKVK